MKYNSPKLIALSASFIITLFILFQLSCMDNQTPKAMSYDEMAVRGKYLVTGASCNDCHSPKVFSEKGTAEDPAKLLSGHPAEGANPPIDTNALHPGYGYTGSADLTAWLGPWGISYTANLTPDSSTGIGAWSEETFIKTLRTGKHLGLAGGRDILPPMPWNYIAGFTDEDLKCIFAYLRTLPAINNRVPAPVSPPDVRAIAPMKSGKS